MGGFARYAVVIAAGMVARAAVGLKKIHDRLEEGKDDVPRQP